MSYNAEELTAASRSEVMVTATAPVQPLVPRLFLDAEIEEPDIVRALFPERATLFRELFVDFVEILREFRPTSIEVISGEESSTSLDLLYRNGDSAWKARHIRAEGRLGHLDSLDEARHLELVLATRVVQALADSLPVVSWDAFCKQVEDMRYMSIENIIDLGESGAWLLASIEETNTTTWFRTFIPSELLTADPFLPTLVTGIEIDRERRNPTMIVHGSGGDLAFKHLEREGLMAR